MRLPRFGLHLEVLETSTGLGIVSPTRGQAPRIGGRGSLPVSLVGKNVTQLEEELACVLSFRPRLELELKELLDHVQLTEVPVDAPRRGEALRESWVQLVCVLEVLQSFDARQKLPFEHPAEPQMELRLDGIVRRGRNAPLELLDQALPVADMFQVRKMLL